MLRSQTEILRREIGDLELRALSCCLGHPIIGDSSDRVQTGDILRLQSYFLEAYCGDNIR